MKHKDDSEGKWGIVLNKRHEGMKGKEGDRCAEQSMQTQRLSSVI